MSGTPRRLWIAGALSLACALAARAPAQDRIAPLKVRVGQPAPDFALKSASGAVVRLSSFRGHNLLVDFYRGYW